MGTKRRTRGERIDVTFADVLLAVCERFQVTVSDLRGRDQHKTVALARHVGMYFCRCRLVRLPSLPEVGETFDRDHTTVLAAVRKVEASREPDVRAHVMALDRALRRLVSRA